MIGLVRLGYGLGRGQHTRKGRSAQCRQHHSDSAMIPFLCRSLHADVVVRHWNTVVDIVETFPNGLSRQPNPFWNLELILGSCDIHKAVVLRLKRNKNSVCVRASPLTTSPMSINNIPLRLKVFLQQCSVTRQDACKVTLGRTWFKQSNIPTQSFEA